MCGENALLPVKTGDLNVERGEGEHVNARHAPQQQIRGEGDGMHGGGYGLRERVVWTRVVRMTSQGVTGVGERIGQQKLEQES